MERFLASLAGRTPPGADGTEAPEADRR
jgi:hypothetical protein